MEYAGYYRFDVDSLKYLANPLDKERLKSAYPNFNSFSQSKQIIPLEYLDDIWDLLHDTNKVSLDDDVDVITEIENKPIGGDEKEALVKVRVNQGIFRDKLLKRYSKCCLCGVCNESLLIASHIKPWSESESREKLDVDNGLLLCPNHDKLFDGEWISFNDDGHVMISAELKTNDMFFMNVREDMKISLSEKNKQYMKYHRNNIFIN